MSDEDRGGPAAMYHAEASVEGCRRPVSSKLRKWLNQDVVLRKPFFIVQPHSYNSSLLSFKCLWSGFVCISLRYGDDEIEKEKS